MVSEQPRGLPGAGSGLDGAGETTTSGLDGAGNTTSMTRRGVLTAGAVGVSGPLFGARGRATHGVRPRATSLDSTQAQSQPVAGEWSQTMVLTAADATPKTRFGYSITVDGNRVLVGADTDDENGAEAGAAYVFELEGDSWTQTQKLTADDGAPGDRFGDVVALDEGRALVGARRSDSPRPETGAAYVFELEGDRWVQTQKLVADDGDANDRFGRGVALDGPRALVGARRNDDEAKDAGAAYVFELDGDRWVQTQKLTAADADPDDRFGRAVALDASRALVGTRLDDERAPDAGAVYVFELVDGQWQQTEKLVAEDGKGGDRFGGAVVLGGDHMLVGADHDDEHAEDGGAVYAFKFGEGRWQPTQKLSSDDPTPGTRFGSTLAIQRRTALVGAEHDSEKGDDAGAVFVFQREENRWRQTQKLTAADAAPDDRFGSAVALGGNRALVGAIHDDTAVDDGGAVYVFTPNGANNGGLPVVSPSLALMALGGVAAVVLAVMAAFGKAPSRLAAPFRGRSDDDPPTELLSDAERVLHLLEDNGGRMKQQDVQRALDWSQTKTSNVVNSMQDDGKIEVYRLGNENTLALPGEIDV